MVLFSNLSWKVKNYRTILDEIYNANVEFLNRTELSPSINILGPRLLQMLPYVTYYDAIIFFWCALPQKDLKEY